MTTPATTPRWVLHLSTETGWRGGERQVWYLARGLQARSLPQAVAAPTDSPLARECEALGVDRLALPARPLLHPVALLRLAAVVRQRPGALLHAHTSRALDAACWLARLAPCAGIVHTRRVAFPVRAAAKYRTACLRYVAISRAVADGLFESKVFELPDPSVAVGAWKQPDALATLDPAALVDRPGCAVLLRAVDGASFAGSTLGSQCVSGFRGAAYATSEVTVTATGLVSWDRGYDAAGKQVWGAEKGGYKFDRGTDGAPGASPTK